MVDLGITGAGVSTMLFEPNLQLNPGERIHVSFFTPTLWDPLTLIARVAWARADGRAGLAFEHKSPPSTYALLELLSALEAQG